MDVLSLIYGFADMENTYPERKVANWRSDDGTTYVSTARVTDGELPYETAIEHPAYNGGRMMIVEAYASKASALRGHAKWLRMLQTDALPNELTDCKNAAIAHEIEGPLRYRRSKRIPKKKATTNRAQLNKRTSTRDA